MRFVTSHMLSPQTKVGRPLRIIIKDFDRQYSFRKKIECLLNRRGINTQLFESDKDNAELGLKPLFETKDQVHEHVTNIAKIATQDGYEIVFD